MAPPPEVTVVIPTRDRWPAPEVAARQALDQSDVPVEVIVVDDGSREPTAARLQALAEPRLRVLRTDLSRGVGAARNLGIGEARGEWTAFLDDDDLWSPRKLRLQLDLARRAEAEWVYAAAIEVDATSGDVWRRPPAPDPAILSKELLIRNVIPCGSSNVVARSEVLRRVRGFDEAFAQLADWDLWIRLAINAHAAACPDVLVAYVLHHDNWLLTDPGAILGELDRLDAKHRPARTAGGVELDRLAIHRWIAWGHRRAGRRAAAARAYVAGGMRTRSPGELARAARVVTALNPVPTPGSRGSTSRARQVPPWLSKHEGRPSSWDVGQVGRRT